MTFSSNSSEMTTWRLGYDLRLKTTRAVSWGGQRERASRTLDHFTGFAVAAVALLAFLSIQVSGHFALQSCFQQLF
jgi:Cu/Ag efflux pump CusA